MEKKGKIIICASVVALLGVGTVFAHGRNNMKGGYNMMKSQNGKNSITADDTRYSKHAAEIGQVTSVDEKNGTIKIADADGKETTVTITPFSTIYLDDSKDEKSISDIKKGSWIMYCLFDTDTENKIASRIFVKTN